MHILLTGGGSGGHVIPLLAVARRLKSKRKNIRMSYVGERGGAFSHIMDEAGEIDATHTIFAGKFRRYHGESLLRRVLDVKTLVLNIRDAIFAGIGCLQAIYLLWREKPDIVFIKGGFVGVPVGLAAALLRIPFVTHDSDAVPGLANRIIGRWATMHATGMPKEFYKYPADKTRFVGVPIAPRLATTPKNIHIARSAWNIPKSAQVLLVTGGSQGSQRINEAIVKIVNRLLVHFDDLHVLHHVGKGNLPIYKAAKLKDKTRVHAFEFTTEFEKALLASDVVVSRAGASSLAEIGSYAKPSIIIPAPFLANGHQVENAKQLAEKQAIICLDEARMQRNPEVLLKEIEDLLRNNELQTSLGESLHKLTKTDAADRIASILLEVMDGSEGQKHEA